jgi:tyrosine-protein kinase Etk/Wzc
MSTPRDTIDFAEVVRVLRRGWRWMAGGVLTGVTLAVLVVLLVPPRFETTTTVLLRSGPEDAGSSLGAAARNAQSGGFSLGGLASVLSLASGFETEIEILTSRSVVEAVVDSLGLQAEVRRPRGVALERLIASAEWKPDPPRRARYRFERVDAGYRVSGPGVSGIASPGVPFDLAGSTITVRAGDLPSRFDIRLFDRYEVVERASRRLRASKAGGDIAQVKYRSGDPETTASVANAIIQKYLLRRQTTDRGVNQRRYEFLLLHADSIRWELAGAEQALRVEQERSGVFDPEMFGQAELEQGLLLRSQLETAEVEARAFRQVVTQASAGGLSPRDLAAYPTFLQNAAINNLLARLTHLEAERTQLLDRRTEEDLDVRLVARQIQQVEDQLVSVSTAYLDGLNRRQEQLRSELGRYTGVLAALPAHAEANYRLRREVRRLSETLVALESELVQARLAAMAEGGDVRQIDPAIPPRRPAFPRPLLTLAVGMIVGLVAGAGGALTNNYLGATIREPVHAQFAAGLPVVAFDPRAPLLLRRQGTSATVLMIPVGAGTRAGAVARRIAATASLQGSTVVLADFEEAIRISPPPGGSMDAPPEDAGSSTLDANERALSAALHKEERTEGGSYFLYRLATNGDVHLGVHAAIQELEKRFSVVVVALPGIDSPVTASLADEGRSAVLVAHAGRTRREELSDAITTLERVGVITAGVVLRRDDVNGDRST